MDELDQLVTKNQSVMYNFFNWPALRHSRLIVLAVANTMDLPERTLSNKISSRLGLTRITFSGYKHQELMEIIGSRLTNVPGNIVDPDAVQFASRKVAAVSGDARRALDICRRAVEIAEQATEVASATAVMEKKKYSNTDKFDMYSDMDTQSFPPTPSRAASCRGRKRLKNAPPSAPENALALENQFLMPEKEPEPLPVVRVTIATIKQAIQEATSTPLQQSLRCLPLSGKVFLAGLLARIRRTGVTESTLGDVLDEAKRIAEAAVAVAGAASAGVKEFLVDKSDKLSHARLRAMGFAAAELMNSGILALEGDLGTKIGCTSGKGDRSGKVRLRVAAEDVRAAFRDDAEAKVLGLGFDQ
jgi:origin recognition complex subunit 1